jgi:hypothetical protein
MSFTNPGQTKDKRTGNTRVSDPITLLTLSLLRVVSYGLRVRRKNGIQLPREDLVAALTRDTISQRC